MKVDGVHRQPVQRTEAGGRAGEGQRSRAAFDETGRGAVTTREERVHIQRGSARGVDGDWHTRRRGAQDATGQAGRNRVANEDTAAGEGEGLDARPAHGEGATRIERDGVQVRGGCAGDGGGDELVGVRNESCACSVFTRVQGAEDARGGVGSRKGRSHPCNAGVHQCPRQDTLVCGVEGASLAYEGEAAGSALYGGYARACGAAESGSAEQHRGTRGSCGVVLRRAWVVRGCSEGEICTTDRRINGNDGLATSESRSADCFRNRTGTTDEVQIASREGHDATAETIGRDCAGVIEVQRAARKNGREKCACTGNCARTTEGKVTAEDADTVAGWRCGGDLDIGGAGADFVQRVNQRDWVGRYVDITLAVEDKDVRIEVQAASQV